MNWSISLLLVLYSAVSLPSFSVSSKCTGDKQICPDTYTCCELRNGSQGCCPIKYAVCCGDSLHCCPEGYTCDVMQGICEKQGARLPLLSKIPATVTTNKVGLSDHVICARGESWCPPDHSCCPLQGSGQYHCCPTGYNCESGLCRIRKIQLPVAALQSLKTSHNIVKCDPETACPDKYTCCKLDTSYVCCPKPQATCCSDHKHCCPRGFVCSPDGKTCSAGSIRVEALVTSPPTKSIAKPKGLKKLLKNVLAVAYDQITKSVGSIICPDGQSECPDGDTCCKLSSGQYGCCPLPRAVCCSDGLHCCPNGYTCDVSTGTCSKGSEKTGLFKKALAKITPTDITAVVCPDGQSECPDGNTCCKLSSGQYGCCPLPKAVCCSDGLHCCPNGYTCDVSAGTCSRGSDKTGMFKKELAKKITSRVTSVVCPDGQSECPDGNTCCKLSSGQYGCCPLPSAVCCSDGLHCCPNGYTCDVSSGTCSKGSEKTGLFKKALAKIIPTDITAVVCPDGQSECPDGNTCCKLSPGQYGCCPLPKAVCCSDGLHCCPNGYTCDVSAGTCSRGSDKTGMFKKELAKKITSRVTSVVCPDGQSECPDGNTCCKLSSGQYGCCPLPSAVCCSDGLHCCPNGYTCDVSTGTCSKGSEKTGLFKKALAKMTPTDITAVVCPDGQSECPDGNTCCKLSPGQYGCCPLPKAVCCSDGLHCCPNGYTCDVSAGTCSRGSDKTGMFKNELAKKITSHVTSVVCPDGQSECPDGNTCCKLSSGQYGCCPFPKAVCCSDGLHCCPNGYTCDLAAGMCTKASQGKLPPLKGLVLVKKLMNVYCKDGYTECPDTYTCCKGPSGEFSCCPPLYECNTLTGGCDKNALESIHELTVIPVGRNLGADSDYVTCPDGSECLEYETCCRTVDYEYGCCPMPHAVCCADHEHCCPCGYRCDLSAEMCITGSIHFPWFKKRDAFRRPQSQQVDLDKKLHFVPGSSQAPAPVQTSLQQECGLYQTPCDKPAGGLFCCPLPNASCCAGGEHCCPQGFSCDQKIGKCAPVKEDVNPPWARLLRAGK